MNNKISFFKKYRLIIVALLTFIALFSLRMAWIFYFTIDDSPPIKDGLVDLRELQFDDEKIVNLDGDWEFYPYQLFTENRNFNKSDKHLLKVPGGWNEVFQEDGEETSFGYGSYRLLLKIGEREDDRFSIKIPSVRSASRIYVNGQLLSSSGVPGPNEEIYEPHNVPQTVTFTNENNEIVELVIEVANYVDSRQSGIIRSISIGSEKAINQTSNLSATIQLVFSIIFGLHAFYAIVLYFLGNRDIKFVYFAILVIIEIIISLLSNNEKLLLQVVNVSYDWSFKLTYILLSLVAYFLMKLLYDYFSEKWRNKILKPFLYICLIIAGLTVLIPASSILNFFFLYIGIFLFSLFSTFYVIRYYFSKNSFEKTCIVVALVALTNYIVFSEYVRNSGLNLIFYPVDEIVIIVAFSLIFLYSYSKDYEQLQGLTVKLQEADALKDRFLAQTSHELKNPLHGIINLSQVILKRESDVLTDESKSDLKNVISVGKRMTYILNDLLEVMRLKEARIPLHKKQLNLAKLVESIVDLLQFMTEGKQVQVINKINDDFPLIYADENRLLQVLFNLIHNSLKYTQEGSVIITASLTNGKATITVTDTGIGMSEKLIKRVYTPYEQGEFDERIVESGFGLGLTISEQLLQLHDSNLVIDSTVGLGTAVSFEIDLAEEVEEKVSFTDELSSDDNQLSEDRSCDVQVQRPKEIVTTVKNRPRILAVDDDSLNLSVLKNILNSEQYEVVTVKCVEEALQLINEERWHLVISDIIMPNISGYELTRRIRQRFNLIDLPIILLTSLSSNEEIEHGFRVGANDFISKPIDANILKARVNSLTQIQLLLVERLQIENALLQAQIQPHFLFNTLNSIAALSQIDNERMLNLLNEFSNYLRMSFDFYNLENLVPIKYELSLVESYLYIEKERFQNKLATEIIVPKNIRLFIPPLTIQPLVENAVKHGILKKSDGGMVTVEVLEMDRYYEVRVTDNGVGIDEDIIDGLLTDNKSQQGIGLRNTHKRLLKTFGRGLEITSKINEATVVSFKVNK